jgi:hypothetical protein
MSISNANAIADFNNKLDRKQISVSSLKCNNINVNVNGLELDVFPSLLGGEVATTAAEDGETNANSFAGNHDGSQINDFRFICINNNNNTVIEERPAIEDECPESDEIQSCFEEFLAEFQLPLFVDALNSPTGITVEINGQDVTLRSFEDICSALEGLTTFEQLREAIIDILDEAFGEAQPINTALFTCIAEALGIPIPPS